MSNILCQMKLLQYTVVQGFRMAFLLLSGKGQVQGRQGDVRSWGKEPDWKELKIKDKNNSFFIKFCT